MSTTGLIFPELATNFNQTLSHLKRATLSIHNRLRSILDDAEFAVSVAESFGFPLIANERCGSWYIPPHLKQESAYFKSTDGHTGQWSFSNRRLNLQVLEVVASMHGCVIVDSTRRGKSMPDALSKTIPIWCAVLNRIIFPKNIKYHSIHTPHDVVSDSEISQIEARLDGFLLQLKTLEVDISAYTSRIQKPLRPVWITRTTDTTDMPSPNEEFYPIVLCTASRRVKGAEISEGGYIQGAGDDAETWAHGLTPAIFWKHKKVLLETSEEKLPSLICLLVDRETRDLSVNAFQSPASCPGLFIGRTRDLNLDRLHPSDAIIWCTNTPPPLIQCTAAKQQFEGIAKTKTIPPSHILHLSVRANKLGSRDLRTQLWSLIPFIQSLPPDFQRVHICCPDGKDLSVGVALAVLCLFQTSSGTISNALLPTNLAYDKQTVRQELAKVMLSMSDVNPSRMTLQSVHTFLFAATNNVNASKPKQDSHGKKFGEQK